MAARPPCKWLAKCNFAFESYPFDDMWRHFDMTGKPCPNLWDGSITTASGASVYNYQYQTFRNDVSSYYSYLQNLYRSTYGRGVVMVDGLHL